MREIKFRFWDAEIDRYVDQEPCMRYWPSSPQEISLEAWLQGDNPVMQYTGLKDKNGKEIYEGDILKNGGVVKWVIDICHEYGCVGWDGIVQNNYDGYYTSEKDEVIGNIYENPELITKI